MDTICSATQCTGCLACMNSCPTDAISVGADNNGSIAPHIDGAKCIDCGLCARVCPANRPAPLTLAPHAYAAWRAEEVLSSSGGIGAVMARKILENGGVVYGAAIEAGQTHHIRVETADDLLRLCGSKYVQSDVGLTYRAAKKDLADGRPVLYIGTPCQIAGLTAFLRKPYEQLVTVDLICHGTPPHRYLQEHLDAAVDGRWDSFSFRGKYDFYMTAYRDARVVYQKLSGQDAYFQAFLRGLTYRDSCYQCPYSRLERVADVTIGDFWGLDRKTLQHPYDGRISVVLPNTEKGQAFFDTVKGSLVYEQRPVEEPANAEQTNLRHPSIPHPDRAAFLAAYTQGGFAAAIAATSIPKELRQDKWQRSLVYRVLRKAKKTLLRRK